MLVVSGTRIRPRRRRASTGSRRRTRPTGCGCCSASSDGRAWFAVIVDAGGRRRPAPGEWTPLRGLLPHLADDALAGAPLVFHALGLAEWLCVTRFCPRCGGAADAARKAGHELACANGHSAVPAHRPGGDHGRHPGRAGLRGRALPARPAGDLARGPLLDAGRLLRAGGDARGRRTPRGRRGGRDRRRRGRVLRQPALAAAGQPDARASSAARGHDRDHGRPATRSRTPAGSPAPR